MGIFSIIRLYDAIFIVNKCLYHECFRTRNSYISDCSLYINQILPDQQKAVFSQVKIHNRLKTKILWESFQCSDDIG